VNRPLLVRAFSVFNRLHGRRTGSAGRRNNLARRSRRFGFEVCEDRSLLAGASITGIKFATVNPSGFSPGDTPLGGVFVDLYKDNGDLVFNPATDSLVDRQQTAVGTGAYTFANVADGHYFIQEEVPTGYFQSAGPAFYTVDVIGGAVYSAATTNIDSFSDPNPASSFFISALNPNPFFEQDSGGGIIGGQRDLLVNVLGSANPISANGFVGTVSVNNGVFNLGTATNGPGTEVVMQYDGLDVDTSALNNAHGLTANLTANGNNGIRFDFNFLQVGTGTTMNLQIAATSPGGGTATFNGLVTQDPTGFSVFVPFSSFSTTGTFSFANVNSLQFSYNQAGVHDVDFEINQIVGANQTNTGFNFGNFPITVSSISGLKYVDSNNNGNHDPGELPIQGVIITLTGTDNLGHAVTQQTQTAADGTFKFSNLQPGTYTLTETPPINFIVGKAKKGSAGGTIRTDTLGQQTIISNIVLPGSTNATDYEFGELGLTPPYVSKRMLLDPAQPVVLTAVYSTTATTGTNSTAAKTTTPAVQVSAPAAKVAAPAVKAAVVTPPKKPAPKPAPKTAVKIPIIVLPKKKGK
jgi:SdrD B-like domain